MNIQQTNDIIDLTIEEIKLLDLSEYIRIKNLETCDYNYMFTAPLLPQVSHPNTYYPILKTVNLQSDHIEDKSTPFKSFESCTGYCNEMNRKLGHTKKSMFMILESIRLEELLRKKLKKDGELKISSDFTIKTSNGNKYVLYDKGNGVVEAASINEALNTGLAAMKREKSKPLKKEELNRHKLFNRRNYNW